MRSVGLTLVAVLELMASPIPGRCAQPPVDFAHDVMPILRKHCVECHGAREANGSFSMNTRELLIDSGRAVAGKPEESLLLTLIASADANLQMPPMGRGRLSSEEQATVRAVSISRRRRASDS